MKVLYRGRSEGIDRILKKKKKLLKKEGMKRCLELRLGCHFPRTKPSPAFSNVPVF